MAINQILDVKYCPPPSPPSSYAPSIASAYAATNFGDYPCSTQAQPLLEDGRKGEGRGLTGVGANNIIIHSLCGADLRFVHG